MPKRRKPKPLTPALQQRMDVDQALGVLKRLLRRIVKGQQVPFLILTVEPRVEDGEGVVAAPVVVSRGVEDPQCAYMVKALFGHLQDIGAVSDEPPGDEDAEDGG